MTPSSPTPTLLNYFILYSLQTLLLADCMNTCHNNWYAPPTLYINGNSNLEPWLAHVMTHLKSFLTLFFLFLWKYWKRVL